MQTVLLLIGLLFLGGGVAGIVAPAIVLRWAQKILALRYGLWLAASGRILIGLLLILAASHTRMPQLVLVLGGMVIGFGFSLPVMGRQRLEEIFRQGLGNTAIAAPASLLSAALGSFLVFLSSFAS